MDIISRIKSFMEYCGISSSQLADTCSIPRPTISQILNGRSKKISNDLIARLHANYPRLSIMWLMFGEGNMLNDVNIQTSEPENDENRAIPNIQNTENQINFTEFPFDTDIHDSGPEKNVPTIEDHLYPNNKSNRININTNRNGESEELEDILHTPVNVDSHKVPNNTSERTISSIMVFYSDDSYKVFTPAK